MFAAVYPLIRLPRRFTFFDYQIPDDLQVEIGDLVNIPFKGRLIIGLVKQINQTSTFSKISNITGIAQKSLMSLRDIERLEAIATNIVQSPASIFYSTLQGIESRYPKPFVSNLLLQKLSVDPATALEVTQALKNLVEGKTAFVQTSLEGTIAVIKNLLKSTKDQVLIITPTERDAIQMHVLISGAHSAVLHGATKPAIRANIITDWRHGKIQLLVGTRQSTLLPARKIGLIIITQSSSDDYRVTDRNPRFDVRLAAELQANQHQARLLNFDHFPRVENQNNKIICTPLISSDQIDTIDLNDKQEWSGQPMVSASLVQAIQEALQSGQKVLCSYNRKGVAKRLQCANCGHLPKCGTCGALPTIRLTDLICPICATEMWPPKTCPACGSAKLKNQGLGNEKIADGIHQLFPDNTVAILEKGQAIPDSQILVATEYYFAGVHQPFSKKQYGLVAELCFDHHISGNFRAREQAGRKLFRLIHLARQQRAKCLVQTWSPTEVKLMLDPTVFLHDELELRKRYHLPPVYDEIYGSISEKSQRAIILEKLHQLSDSEIIQTDIDSYASPRDHTS